MGYYLYIWSGMSTNIQAHIGLEPYSTRISMRGHVIIGDEPLAQGGKDKGPTAKELLLSGLAHCTAATIKMYAERKEWPLAGVRVDVSLSVERHPDGSQTTHIHEEIKLEGPLSADQKDRLGQIAKKCPVHKILTNEIRVETTLAEMDT